MIERFERENIQLTRSESFISGPEVRSTSAFSADGLYEPINFPLSI